MSAIEQIRNRLTERGIPFIVDGARISVPPAGPNGFEVSLYESPEESTVFYEGWHEHFTSAEQAVKCFLFGLSPRCRIAVTLRGGKAHHWVMEAEKDGKWQPYGSTGLLFFAFWRRAEVRYLQNNVGT